ncbi:MAG: heat-inducible transcription repressor HrcA [Clostridia bacterium]|nr:heat-inducible transcription repressor HrcA [Clostridia bacterium]
MRQMEAHESVLSERKKQILKAIVDAHVAGGEPVGSKVLMQQIACSSATIRNEMAELEEMGYLEQPHTSAGRVPSEMGYRFYVDSLVEHYAMTAREIAQINQALKAKMSELDQILTTASTLASNLTNYTGFALKPRSRALSVSRFEAIYIAPGQFVLVMVADDGSVKTRNVKLDLNCDSASVARLAATLNRYMTGRLADEITLPTMVAMEEAMAEDGALISPVIKIIYETMNESDRGELKVTGVDRLLEYPEYSDASQLKGLLGALEQKNDLMEMISTAAERDPHGVVIGSEASVKEMNNSTVVFKTIVKDGKPIGAIGVIGPLRMDYARVLSTLDGLSGNIADLLGEGAAQLGDGGVTVTDQESEDDNNGRQKGQNGNRG